MNFLYLILDLGAISVPFLFSFHPKINFYKKAKFAWISILSAALIFIVWDIYYTHLGVWGFNPRYLSGFMFFNLPIEEVLFFICIPYACLFTYYCFTLFVDSLIFKKAETFITAILLVFLLVFGFLNFPKLYTFYTFIPLAITLAGLKFYFKMPWLNKFYFSYLVLLIPFTIVNGILTGTGLEEPVVWYNDLENMGFRILTIPFEDVFYGMLLILLNVTLFEIQNKVKFNISQNAE
jgi:lycopene cyclase domain-containing protein